MTRLLLRIGCVAAWLAGALLPLAQACANDPPAKGNRAAQEALEIERGVYAVPAANKARFNVFSLFADKLTWQRDTLPACFWNGTPALQAKVAEIADELTAQLSVKFVWRDSSGQLAQCPGYQDDHGAWHSYPVRVSLVASDVLLIPGDNRGAFFALIGQQKDEGRRATVNLPIPNGWAEARIRHNVLHEFCHVLGCLHEFQRDICTKDFDPAKIRAMFGLTAAEYDTNFARIPSGHVYGVSSSVFDTDSVMMYQLTADFFRANTHNPCMKETPASVLSVLDIEGLGRAYTSPPPSLTLADFGYRAQANRAIARSQRLLAASLRATQAQLKTQYSILGLDVTGEASKLEATASEAEAKAAIAEQAAASYALTPAQEAAIRLALSHFPSGD